MQSVRLGAATWFRQFLQDARYGMRTLVRAPAFAATTVLTLAIGLALTTAVFTVFDAYLLRTYAVRDAGNLYAVGWQARDAGGSTLRWRDYLALRDRGDVIAGAVAASTRYVTVKG